MPTIDKIRVGSTDYSLKDTEALHLPANAPTSVALIGVDTANKQTNLVIGEGLKIENGVLKVTSSAPSTYITPRINSVTMSPYNGGTYEIGETKTVTSISVRITKGTSDLKKIEVLGGNSSTVLFTQNLTGFVSGNTVTLTVNNSAFTMSSTSTYKYFTIKVTDTQDKYSTATTSSFAFVYPYYYGVADVGVDINAQLILSANFTKKVAAKGTQTVYYTANDQKIVFASPYEVGKIKDPNNFTVTSNFLLSRITISGQSYYVYTAKDATTVSDYEMTFEMKGV